jgi:hypothetical protein
MSAVICSAETPQDALALYAALNIRSGYVLSQTTAHHITEQFVAFWGVLQLWRGWLAA